METLFDVTQELNGTWTYGEWDEGVYIRLTPNSYLSARDASEALAFHLAREEE